MSITSSDFQSELFSLLVSGQDAFAQELYLKNNSKYSLDSDIEFLIKRYLDRKNLNREAKQIISYTRDLLLLRYGKPHPPSYLSSLAEFQNIIIISNSSLLEFDEQDKLFLRSLDNSLYVYLNIGNPMICHFRKEFYGLNSKEILVGGHHHIVDSDHKLFFRPFSDDNFLGCLVRVNSRFQKLWFNELRHKALFANPLIDFFEFEETLLVESAYPLSVYNNNQLKKRIPSIGWLVMALFDSIASFVMNDRPNIWLAGFSLSPSYIFQASGNISQHDFCFEKEALECRLCEKNINIIGVESSNRSESSTQQQLHLAYPGRIQLSKYLREKGKI